jgi:hypothetical protein
MRTNRYGLVIAFLIVLGSWPILGRADSTDGESIVRQLQCTPVGTVWPASASSELAGPQLSVVMTDLRPKDARLFLDGRFIGRARFFNAKKGLLFLQPGKYRLEARIDGYRTELFEITAAPNCRFNLKHRMIRQRGAEFETSDLPTGKGAPNQRVYGPLMPAPSTTPSTDSGRADLSLRPDLGGEVARQTSRRRNGASLTLRVRPGSASVYLDDVFVATGAELDSMVGPLAISTGSHQLRVEAPGFAPRTLSFEVAAGEVFDGEVVLQRSR